MKTTIILTFVALALGFLAGCQTVNKDGTSKADSIIQVALSAVLPPSHTGYAKFVHANQYFTLSIEADGLECVDGVWKYTWLTYNRQSHFPIFSGLTWSSTGDVTLGKKP